MSGWSLACPDWEERIRAGRSLIPHLPLNRERAERAVAIFDRLRLADVPGNPTLREAAGDWFRELVAVIFGSWFPEQQERFIREVLALVPKKNSKTSYGAGLMLTALLMNERPQASFHLFAPTQDITDLAFDQVAGMIRLDETLRTEYLWVRDHIKTIVQRSTGGTLEVMSFDPRVVTGQKSAGWLLDELHVLQRVAKASSALRQLRGGMLPLPEAFGLIITTQSETPPSGIFRIELNKARAARDGKIKGRTLAVLYEFPKDIARNRDAWRDPKNWPMVLPNLGRSITVPRLQEGLAEADLAGEEEVRTWASQHLNVEIGLALGSDNWPGADFWERRAIAVTLEELIERCEVIVVGLDGGGLDDLFGFCALGREKDTKRWIAWHHAWAHRVVLKRRKSEAPKILDFVEVDELTLFGSEEEAGDFADALDAADEDGDESAAAELKAGAPEDIAGIVALVGKIDRSGKLAGVGLDPAGIGAIVDALAEIGIGGQQDSTGKDRVIGVSQGWKLMGAIKTVERKLADGTFFHSDQALMNWCVGNAKVEPKGNAMIITKQASGSAKIDPLMALFDAAALMALNPTAPGGGPSVYEERGLVFV